MSIEHVTLAGSHYDIGVALGRLARQAIRGVVPRIERVKVLRQDWSGSDRLARLMAAARDAYPDYYRELEGIATGAEVAFDDIFLWNCRGDLPDDAQTGNEGALGCTTILSPGSETRPISIAHNEDGHRALHGHCALVTLRPRGSVEITSFYYPGLLCGHNFGFNEYGLVQTVNHLRPRDHKIGVPRHLISRAALASRSLDDAVRIFQRGDRAGGFHYALAQCGDKRLLSVEAPASGCAVREIQVRTAHANHLLYDEFARLRQVVTPSSRLRQQQAEALISGSDRGLAGALNILANADHADYPICLKENSRDDSSYTLASAAFEVYNQYLDWSVYAHPDDAPVLSGGLRCRDR